MTKILLILLTVFFTVNFWSDNTKTKLLSSQQVKEASDAVPPADPDSACHSFTGWDKRYDNVLEDLDIHATYTKNQYTLNIDNEHMSSEHGSIRALSPYSFNASGVIEHILCGETVTVCATPDDGYKFVKWVLNGPVEVTASSTLDILMTRDTAIYAVFEVDPATDITDTKTDVNAYKRIENNHVVIIRNNEKYDVAGKKL